jgi:hypothetical protein
MAQYLVWVNVKVDKFGHATYNYHLNAGPVDASSVPVHPGDQVAWYVQVYNSSNGASQVLPYQLTFANPLVFGTGSVSVPAGGYSPYLQVINLPGNKSKYTLSVTGISPVSDPEIIVVDNGFRKRQAVAPSVTISWQQPTHGHPNGVMTYTDSSGQHAFQPPPYALPLTPGSDVVFQVQPAAPFYVQFPFDPNHGPQTPFLGYPGNTISGTNQNGGVESTDQLQVAHNPDPTHPIFQFYIVLQDGSAQSNTFDLSVAS